MQNDHFTSIDFTAVSTFVSQKIDTILAPFATIGVDVSSEAPEGSSVKVYGIGTALTASTFNGEYQLQNPYATGYNVALTHKETSFIIRDVDVIDAGTGALTSIAQGNINAAVGALATEVQKLFVTPLTGSSGATGATSVSSSAFSYATVVTASITVGETYNWANDGTNYLLLPSGWYRKLANSSDVVGNYSTADALKTGAIPNVCGFNVVETNAFPGTISTAGAVKGLAIRKDGLAFVMRPIAVDPLAQSNVEQSQIFRTEKGFVYTLKTWREPRSGGRAWVIELQAGAVVADAAKAYRLINLG